MIRIYSIFFMFTMMCISVQAQPKPLDMAAMEALKKAAQDFTTATVNGESNKVNQLTDPSVSTVIDELIKEKKIPKDTNSIAKTLAMLKENGYTIENYQVSKPEAFHPSSDTTFAVVPTTIDIKSPKGTLRERSYLLGVSRDKNNLTWKFVNGALLQDNLYLEKMRSHLPLPGDLMLPKRMEPEFIKP